MTDTAHLRSYRLTVGSGMTAIGVPFPEVNFRSWPPADGLGRTTGCDPEEPLDLLGRDRVQ